MTVPGMKLTEEVFARAERHHPDLMEPWSTRVASCEDAAERQRVMRTGLAATFRARFPLPPGEKWSDEIEAEKAARAEAEVRA